MNRLGVLNRLGHIGIMDRSSSQNWTPQNLVVEDAAPTHVVMTSTQANTNLVASDFVITGITANVLSISRDGTNKVITAVLDVPVYYGEVLNVVIKGKSYSVTNNVAISAEYTAVYNAMVGKPTGNDIVYQNKWRAKIRDLAEAKAILLDNFSMHNKAASFFNWKNPAQFNPSSHANLTAVQYAGITKIAGYYETINLNFTPSVNGAGFLGQDDITVIVGVNSDTAANEYILGSIINTKDIRVETCNTSHYSYRSLNTSTMINNPTANSKRYLSLVRNNGANVNFFKNLVKRVDTSVSVGLCDSPLFGLGLSAYSSSVETVSFILIFKALTDSETRGIIKTCDDYLKNYGTHIMTFSRKVDFNVLCEGHSFENDVNFPVDGELCKINAVTTNILGVAGNSIAQMVTRAVADDACLIAETATYKNIMVLCIGVNDLSDNTAGRGLTAYNAMRPFVVARAAAGWKVMVYTMTPSTYGGRAAGFEAERVIFNGLMRSDLALVPNVYILDTDTVPNLCDPSNATYFITALHPNYGGALLMGDLLATQLTALYG